MSPRRNADDNTNNIAFPYLGAKADAEGTTYTQYHIYIYRRRRLRRRAKSELRFGIAF